MGLLDEAIREHLALKRGRGADPAEIAREEKEALGPPTRTQAPQAERAREERGESEDAALDEPATGFAPGDDAPRADREPRLQLADEPRERPTGEPPAAQRRLRITEEDLRERMPGAGAPPPPPPVAPADDVPVHDEPVAPVPPPADDDIPPDLADDEPHTDDFVFGDEDDDDFFADELGEPRADEPLAPPRAPLPERPLEPPAPEPPEEPARYTAVPGHHDEPLGDDPAGAPFDQPTEQYALEDVEDATRPPVPPAATPADEEDEPEGEELLEETPEFLEETPEHDRLWFEQKPPRDFDF